MEVKIKIIFGVLFFCGILTWSFGVSAETIFADDFNAYSAGTLNGQGGWQATPAFIVTDNPVREGAGALFSSNFNVTTPARKLGTLLNDGKITVYVRRLDANQPGILSFILKEGASAKIEVRGNYGASTRFQHIDGSSGSYVNFGPLFNFETWYAIQIEWRASDHSARYNIDGGTWTDWFPSIAPWSLGLDTVELQTTNSMMWDAIQENPIGTKTPVLIVPGLTGTELKDGNELLWADTTRMATDVGDQFMDKLLFDNDLSSVNESIETGNLIGNILTTHHIYDLIIDELQNQGYALDENLFLFPYDWRYGVTGEYPDGKTNTVLLAEKIAGILEQTDADKVDVIAHSMGGLIVKQYAKNHPTDNHIRKAVFVGVPNTGAPKSVKTLLEGDNLGMFFVSQDEIKKISENMPAIYDLLPSQKYYDVKGSYVKVIDQGLTGLFTTVKDLNYTETKSFLANDSQLNDAAINNADSLHTQSFDDFDLRSAGIDVYAIDGCKAGTLGKITQVKSKSILGQTVIDYKQPQMVPGDGTVPLESATNLPVDASHKFYSLTGEHGKMLSQDGSRQQIVNLISGSALEVNPGIITQNIGECQLNGKAISVFSLVDISVTDADGNELRLAQDGSVFNEIPNAAFEIMGGHTFLYLPTDSRQTYDIALDGMGTGTYTIKTDDIENNEVVKTQVFSNLPVTPDLTGTVNLTSAGAQDSLTVKQNAGSAPQTILPSAVVDGPDAQDLLAPISTIMLNGKAFIAGQFAGEFKKEVAVKLQASDAASGVLNITYSIDGGVFKKVAGFSAGFIITAKGNHSIRFYATDNAGNNEALRTITFTVKK